MELLTLATRLELGPMPPDEGSAVLIRVAEKVSTWHSLGLLHRELCPSAITLGATLDDIEVSAPRSEALTCGGPDWDPDRSPVELCLPRSIDIPRDLSDARIAFTSAKIPLDPRQIDIYQLGSLFCLMLTGENTNAYLSSSRTKSRIPEKLRPLLDRSLGAVRGERWNSAADLVEALRSCQQLPGQAEERSTARSEDAVPLTQIGDCTIQQRIGRGGMGDVYLARDARTGRTVAVKVLPDELARHSDFVRRFYAEAAAAARLIHPNIIEILFVGEDKGRHYFVMEYVAGESLADRLARDKQLPIAQCLQIARQLLSALQMAHGEGLIHRDIKPGNILLDESQQRAVLADFGLVKSLQETMGLTATGMVVGSVQYISPEQARGRAVDGRSDLYSLGVLLYQMLSGALPFTGEGTTSLIFQHVYEPPRPLIEVAPTASPVLGAIVDKLLAKSPDDRYATAAQVAADLEACVAGQPLPSGADIFDADDESSEATDSSLAQTAVIAAPRFDQVPVFTIPEVPEPTESVVEDTIWWHRAQRAVWDAFRKQAPEIADVLLDTGQRIEGAVAEYERRNRELQRLSRKALQVLHELRTQRDEWLQSLSAAEARLDTATDKIECLEEQTRCQKNVAELNVQIQQQHDELSGMRLQQAKVSATLERMRSQHDLLQARMKVAEACLRMAGIKRRRQYAVSLSTLVGVLVVLVLVWIALDRTAIGKATKDGFANLNLFWVKRTLGPMPLGIPENQWQTPRQQLKGNTGAINSMAFAPDGKEIYAGGRNGHLVAWDLKSGQQSKEYVQISSLGPVAIDPKTQQVWAGTAVWAADLAGPPEEHVRLRNMLLRNILPTGNPDEVIAIGMPSDNRSPVFLYNPRQHTVLQTIAENSSSVAYAPEVKILVHMEPSDPEIHLWSFSEQRELRRIPLRTHEHDSTILAVSGDARRIAFYHLPVKKSGLPGVIEVWSLQHERLEFRRTVRGNRLVSMLFQPVSGALAVGCDDQIELWDLERGVVRERFQARDIDSIAFSSDGDLLAAGTKSGVLIWDSLSEPRELRVKLRELKGSSPAGLSPDATRYWSAENGILVLHELSNDQEVRRLSDYPLQSVQRIAFSPDDTHVVMSISAEKDPMGRDLQRLQMFDVQANKLLHTQSFAFPFVPYQFSLDGHMVYVARTGQLTTWEVRSGAVTTVASGIHTGNPQCMAISRDGKIIAVAGYGSGQSFVWLYNLDERRVIQDHVSQEHNILAITFSTDGSRIAWTSKTQISVMNVVDGVVEHQMPVASAPSAIAFSRSNDRLAICGKEEALSIWGLASGKRLQTFVEMPGVPFKCEWVGYTPDGLHLVAIKNGKLVLIIDPESSQRV